ncbi:MAG: diadenylate cyclase [Planctomycetota bacterium]|nr:diadenylate cyclase [Planctomycetota bacterium]
MASRRRDGTVTHYGLWVANVKAGPPRRRLANPSHQTPDPRAGARGPPVVLLECHAALSASSIHSRTSPVVSEIFADICCPERRGINVEVLESVLYLAVEIAREGREGRKIGTLITVGDADNVIAHSRPLILDPLFGHPDEKKLITLPDVRETVKELAQLDGAFVISNAGVVVSAARYIDVLSEGVSISLGLGSRHMAGASISRRTDTVAVVVSESSMVRVFDDGVAVSEILPELWMLRRHGVMFDSAHQIERTNGEVVVRTKGGA